MDALLKRYAWPLLLAVFVIALGIGTFTDSGTHTLSQQQRVDRLAAEVRCPTCEGLSVQESVSPLAESAKQEITAEVAAGRTDAQIKAYFISRYGATALMTPKRTGFIWTAWLLPAAIVFLLIAGVVVAIRKWGGTKTQGPSERERQRVEMALNER